MEVHQATSVAVTAGGGTITSLYDANAAVSTYSLLVPDTEFVIAATSSASDVALHRFESNDDFCFGSRSGKIVAPNRSLSPLASSAEHRTVKVEVVTDLCSACHLQIYDQTLLSVGPRFYHESCLQCNSCTLPLQGELTCYFRDGSAYCKGCYARQFGIKCTSCDRLIQSHDWVRRARNYVFHLACFSCDHCKRQLSTGEEFALQEGRLLCKQHFVELVEGDSANSQQKQKTKRVRTTFADEQLSVLQAHFQIDSNPDGADLERIANMTGLSKRVTQVWFQNSRARQKKYQGNRKDRSSSNGDHAESGRSTGTPGSPGGKSETSSCEGMQFPTSVTTSAEDAVPEHQLGIPMQYE